jgi:hypothetical protein
MGLLSVQRRINLTEYDSLDCVYRAIILFYKVVQRY